MIGLLAAKKLGLDKSLSDLFAKTGLQNVANKITGAGGKDSLSPATMNLLAGAIGSSAPVPLLQDIKYEDYTPEQLQYLGDLELQNLSDTELRKILTDAKLKDIQYNTLDQLGE